MKRLELQLSLELFLSSVSFIMYFINYYPNTLRAYDVGDYGALNC